MRQRMSEIVDKENGVPFAIQRMAWIVGLLSGGLAAGNAYSAVRGLLAVRYLSTYTFYGYGLVVVILLVMAAAVLAGEAFLMHRMYREWRREDADRYMTGMAAIGVALIVIGLADGLIMPSWVRYMPGWVWENVSLSICGVVAYYLVCGALKVTLEKKFSLERVKVDLKWLSGR